MEVGIRGILAPEAHELVWSSIRRVARGDALVGQGKL